MPHTSWSFRVALLVVVLAVFAVCPVWGQTIDPAVLFISSTGTFCQNGGACVVNNEANPLSPTTLSIFENGNGQPALVGPVLLIVGIPNATSGAPTGVTLSMGTGTLGGADKYGGTWSPSTGFGGSFQSSSTQDVYRFLGMVQGNGSENFTNWSGADAAVGPSATSFGIFVYELTGTGLTGGGSVGVTFSSPLPLGSVVVAYGCSVTLTGNSQCNAPENPYGTPFTEAGVVVPEPASLALFGSGVIALALAVRRRFRAS